MIPPKILPSILSADLLNLSKVIDNIIECKTGIHFDVMDNHYVPNLTFGPLLLKAIKNKYPNLWVDVHLMITPVEPLLDEFIKLKADQISFHPKTTENPEKIIRKIKANNILAGMALNPDEDYENLHKYIDLLDFILVMSVDPGFAGQDLRNNAINNLKYCKLHFPNKMLFVDGGVKLINISTLKEAGAQHFIVGSAIFNEHDSIKNNFIRFNKAI